MLQVREKHQHQKTVLILTGPFNRRTTPGLQARILGVQETGCHHIILDFSGVTEIDSTGLGELFLWYNNLGPHRVKISIVKPQDFVRTYLDWSHISEMIAIYESADEAVEYAGAFV